MIKKTLLAIAVMALLASVTFGVGSTPWPDAENPKLAIYNFVNPADKDDDEALKVDGEVKVFWPFDYKFLEICRIPVRMKVGMFIRVLKCDDKKITIVQKDCKDQKIGKGDSDWPCYQGCVTVEVIANFKAELQGKIVNRNTAVFPDGGRIEASITPNVIEKSTKTPVEVCVKAWQVKIENIDATGDDSVQVAEVSIQARPAV